MNDFIASHSAQSLKPFESEIQSAFSAESQSAPRLKVGFSVGRKSKSLEFTFVLTGGLPVDLAEIVIPELKTPSLRARRDELWKSTCFEIFVGSADSRSYLEFNLSPAGDWNVYSFAGYREGMKVVRDVSEIQVSHSATPQLDDRSWSVVLTPSTKGEEGELAALLESRGLVLGATAVIEYQNGQKEYWALSHAGDKPDFHLRESFRLAL